MKYGRTKDRLVACVSSVIHREQGFQDYRFVVKTILEKYDIEAVRNYEDIHNQRNFNAVLQDECHLFVLLLGDVPSRVVQQELNIAVARGLPIFVFIKSKWDNKGNLVDPIAAKTFLLKAYPELYHEDRIYFDSAEELAKLVDQSADDFVRTRLLVSPIIGQDPPIAYTDGVRLIEQARYRIVLVQKTSIFLLGARTASEPEVKFYNTLMKWLETKGRRRLFIHYFSWKDTQSALGSRVYDIESARKRASKLLKRKSDHGLRIVFRASQQMDIVSHLVADTGLGLNFWVGERRYYLFLPCFMTKEKELEQIVNGVQATGQQLGPSQVLDLYRGTPL